MGIDIVMLVGRALLAAIFLEAGFAELRDLEGTAGYFAGLGLPFPFLAALGGSVFSIIAGLCVLFGVYTRIAAWALAGFAVAAASIGHYGQGGEDAMLAMMHRQAFMKDIAIAGGLLVLGSLGPGRLSLDRRRRPLTPSFRS